MRTTRAIAAFVVGFSFLSLAAPATADRINPGHQKSWGKAQVSFDDYAKDSVECAHAASDMSLEGTAPAKALELATRMSEQWGYGGDILQIARVAPLDVQFNRAATIMRNALEGCLAGRGYVKFELTDEQYGVLKELEPGSLERRSYLHSLASDPAILEAQALSEA